MLDDVALSDVTASAADMRAGILFLYGGAALYLVSLSMLRWRVRGGPSIPRTVLAAVLLGVAALLRAWLPGPLIVVAIVTAGFVGLVSFDAVRYGRTTRSMRLGEPA
jgi:hypothetical protein